MSPVDSILGIRDVLIDRVERGREIHVWARPATRLACIHCQQGSVRIKVTHQRTLKHTRQGNQLMVLHLVAYPSTTARTAIAIFATLDDGVMSCSAGSKRASWTAIPAIRRREAHRQALLQAREHS